MFKRCAGREFCAILLAAALLLGAPSRAADLLIAAPYAQFSMLRDGSEAWQEETGHRVLWLPQRGGKTGAHDSARLADLFLQRADEVLSLSRAGLVRSLAIAGNDEAAEDFGALLVGLLSAGRQNLFALPFSASFPLLRYRLDFAAAANVEISAEPSWAQIAGYAARIADPVAGVHGFCPPGIGGNPAVVRAVVAARGGRWLAGDGEPAFDSNRWRSAAEFYARLLAASGPPNSAYLDAARVASLVARGKCGMWLAEAGSAGGELDGALPVPGASAWVATSLFGLAVHAESGRPGLAAEFAWWVSSSEFSSSSGRSWAGKQANLWPLRDERRVVLAEMAQNSAGADLLLRWDEQDARLALGLARLINGEIGASEALVPAAADN